MEIGQDYIKVQNEGPRQERPYRVKPVNPNPVQPGQPRTVPKRKPKEEPQEMHNCTQEYRNNCLNCTQDITMD